MSGTSPSQRRAAPTYAMPPPPPAAPPHVGEAQLGQQQPSYQGNASVEYVDLPPEPASRSPPPVQKPQQKRPWLSYTIVLGCLAGFAYSLYITPGIIAPLNMNPLIGPTPNSLVTAGAKVTCLINESPMEWWRLVTPMWLHAGVVHLLANMHMLSKLGFELERQAGPIRFVLIYVLGSVFSMVTSALFRPQSVTVGASGALFALLGAYLAELITNCHLLSVKEGLCAFASLFISIAINLAIGLLPFVDNFAHIGGLVGGMLIGFVVLLHSDRQGELRCKQITGAVLAAIGYVLLLGAGILLLYLKVELLKYCPQCVYMGCVPAPWWSCDAANSAKLSYCSAFVSDGGRRLVEAAPHWLVRLTMGEHFATGLSALRGSHRIR